MYGAQHVVPKQLAQDMFALFLSFHQTEVTVVRKLRDEAKAGEEN
jgi:hypothetical protein